MNLIIHDLNEEEWNKVSSEYSGWEVISYSDKIKPCAGCFGCWIKSPGECVIKDGYDKMGALIHKADEVVVISRYTYGGFSSFVKNVFDRSIGWVLPFFEIHEGEMHHKRRYPEDKSITFIFRGNDLSEEDKEDAKKYVAAVCRNFRGIVKEVRFEEAIGADGDISERHCVKDNSAATKTDTKSVTKNNHKKVILLNGSMRGDKANSKHFLDRLSKDINGDVESINLSQYINKQDELVEILSSAGKIVLGFPLYVDGVPSQMLKIMEKLEKTNPQTGVKIYSVINMGFYESSQIKNALKQIKNWCRKSGYEYCGGVAIGAGEMVGQFTKTPKGSKNPGKNAFDGLDRLSETINEAAKLEDIYADSYLFPRALYMHAANFGWPASGKQNGLKKKDLLRTI